MEHGTIKMALIRAFEEINVKKKVEYESNEKEEEEGN
jgi:hypothetical protein